MKWRNLVFSLTALLVIVADQFTKIWIRSNLAPGEVIFELGFLRIIRIHNTGAAFGLFQGWSSALIVVGLLGIVAILAYAIFFYRQVSPLNDSLVMLALGLILGGTVGNMADRLNPALGGVTDFISVGIWPSFNVADAAIVTGIIIFTYFVMVLARAKKPDLPV